MRLWLMDVVRLWMRNEVVVMEVSGCGYVVMLGVKEVFAME